MSTPTVTRDLDRRHHGRTTSTYRYTAYGQAAKVGTTGVLATEPDTGERGPREVTKLWVHEDTVVNLEFHGTAITTTEDHPFWNATDGEFQRADELDRGDQLLAADGRTVRVGGIHPGSQRAATAYNLTVDDIHTYYVLAGKTPVLVHNTGPGCRGIALGLSEVANNPMALHEFADSLGARSYHDWPSRGDKWVSEFKGYVNDGKTSIHFNLNGIDDPVAAARTGRGWIRSSMGMRLRGS
ncbi:polymorphic toxin-type HINT domain-containing protein [Kribbella sp. NPDC050124]|uniref:polymorphic toxin-type HINT domain-containing protein n=1 Tax=Kribbella sp. NPDC050124 TaxID=3364114 RepID=UPI00378FBA52